MMHETRTPSTVALITTSAIDLAVRGWLAAHASSTRTQHAYQTTLEDFRAGLHRIGKDLDADVQTLILLAQEFAAATTNPKKGSVAPSTYNVRLDILRSFYTYAMSRYLLQPMDEGGHILNPISVVKRQKVYPYQGVHALAADEVIHAVQQIDRSTLLGSRDYALLAVLLQTGRRLSEVTALCWQDVQRQGRGSRQTITLTFTHCKGDKIMRDTLPASISRAVLSWLAAYYGASLDALAANTPLWVSLSTNTKQRGRPLGIQAVQQVCEKYLATHTHATRHTFTHNMIQAGATLPEIQARLGHASLATTGAYARSLTSADNPHAEALARMHGFTE